MAPDPTKVILNEGVPSDHNSDHDATINSGSLKIRPAEAVSFETPAPEASKVLPSPSAQDNSTLQAGVLYFLLSSFERLLKSEKKGNG